MPYMRFDQESFDEIVSEMGDDLPPDFADQRPSGNFEYETAEASLKPAKLGTMAKAVYDVLIDLGATAFRVRYDGGYDEGFAHPEAVVLANAEMPADALAQKLTSPEFSKLMRSAANVGKSQYGNGAEVYANASDRNVANYALDELAHELASKLLGDGYGTGEYQLYGAFTADLRTGQITDDPAAPKPADME